MANLINPDNTVELIDGYYKHKGGTANTTGATLNVRYDKNTSTKLTVSALTLKKGATEKSYITEQATDGKISIWEAYFDADTDGFSDNERMSIPVAFDLSDVDLFWKVTIVGVDTNGIAWISSYLNSKV